MSHTENDKFVEDAFQQAEEAVIEGDSEALVAVYWNLEENGFSEEADELRKQFGILNV